MKSIRIGSRDPGTLTSVAEAEFTGRQTPYRAASAGPSMVQGGVSKIKSRDTVERSASKWSVQISIGRKSGVEAD